MPPGSLGRLLDLGRQLAAIQRTDRPWASPRWWPSSRPTTASPRPA